MEDEQDNAPEKMNDNKYIRTSAGVATCRICGATISKSIELFIEAHLRMHNVHYKKRYLF
jgi:hypothetical protein